MKYVQSDNKFIVEMIHCHLNNACDKLLLCLTVDLIKYACKACMCDLIIYFFIPISIAGQ